MTLALFRRTGRRTPPVEYADAVEKWARSKGRHAKLVWDARCGNWQVHIELTGNDPRLQLETPTEVVELLKPGFLDTPTGRKVPGLVGVELDELGVQGIIDHLNETNLETGRFRSPQDALRHSREQNRTLRDRERAFQKDETSHLARDEYRRVMGHPLISGADLVAADQAAAPQED